ncbi:MAG: type II toxin-antitoxin system PemK/MazF family toxin [bacterium]
MARVLRGDIIWADLDPTRGHEQAGLRPVLVISEDVFNQRSGTVVALAITSAEPTAGFPLTLELRSARLPKRSWVKMGQIRTLSTERLGKRLARLAPEELARVVEGLNEIIGG